MIKRYKILLTCIFTASFLELSRTKKNKHSFWHSSFNYGSFESLYPPPFLFFKNQILNLSNTCPNFDPNNSQRFVCHQNNTLNSIFRPSTNIFQRKSAWCSFFFIEIDRTMWMCCVYEFGQVWFKKYNNNTRDLW